MGLIGKAGLVMGAAAVMPLKARASGGFSHDEVRVGIIGIGNKGRQHITNFGDLPGVRVVAVADVDPARKLQGVALAKTLGSDVKGYTDARHILDRKDVDAIVIATPNHWHALLTIWGCEAGKHVYVEKPVCHNIWEGHKMLEAQDRYDRIVQAGTQNRTNPGFSQTVEYLREQPLGKIQWIQGFFNKLRGSIGMTTGPQALPPGLDYNLYCGPAPLSPVRRERFHYDWHWQWDTGNGDLGNNGPHITDYVRQLMGDDIQPRRIMSYGGRFLFNDSGQTPNTQVALYDYDGIPVSIEIRNLSMRPGLDAVDHLRGVRIGCVIQCEDGYVTAGHGGGVAYSSEGKKIRAFPGDAGAGHAQNFIDAVRANDRNVLNAPLKVGVEAAELFHLGNLSWRVGAPETGSPYGLEEFPSAVEAMDSVRTPPGAARCGLG